MSELPSVDNSWVAFRALYLDQKKIYSSRKCFRRYLHVFTFFIPNDKRLDAILYESSIPHSDSSFSESHLSAICAKKALLRCVFARKGLFVVCEKGRTKFMRAQYYQGHCLLVFSSVSHLTKLSIKLHHENKCLYNFDPLKPHFYIVKAGFTGVYIIFLISARRF